jgi:hypothetical protein
MALKRACVESTRSRADAIPIRDINLIRLRIGKHHETPRKDFPDWLPLPLRWRSHHDLPVLVNWNLVFGIIVGETRGTKSDVVVGVYKNTVFMTVPGHSIPRQDQALNVISCGIELDHGREPLFLVPGG